MRELERDPSDTPFCARLAIVGRGRLGNALGSRLGIEPLGRGASVSDVDAVLLCVPDREIRDAAAAIPAGQLVGHCSGASDLSVLGAREGFSIHPLMTVTREGAQFAGAGAAIDGSTDRALSFARELALALGMRPVVLPGERVLYHAAASMASNFLVTLEAAAERLAAAAGVERELLVPLVRATVENWAALGGERALTGPVARGDEQTVARQRDAIAAHAEDLLPLFDALARATRELVAAPEPVA